MIKLNEKSRLLILLLVLLSNSSLLLAQTEPEDKLEVNKFQDYFSRHLSKGIENYDKAIVALEQCLKIEPEMQRFISIRNYLALKIIKCLHFI
jgi:hypothetical protein